MKRIHLRKNLDFEKEQVLLKIYDKKTPLSKLFKSENDMAPSVSKASGNSSIRAAHFPPKPYPIRKIMIGGGSTMPPKCKTKS